MWRGVSGSAPSTGCTLSGQDYNGRLDIEGTSAPVSSIEACAQLCTDTPTCSVAAYTGGTRYPKNTLGDEVDYRDDSDLVVPAGSLYPCGMLLYFLPPN